MLIRSVLCTKLLDNCSIILLERPTENHIYGCPLHLAFETLFDNIRRKLQLTESYEVSGNHPKDLIVAARVVQLQHVLHQVVAEGVLYEAVQVRDDHVGEGQFLLFTAFLEATLHHATTVLVGTYLYTVRDTGVEDKLGEVLKVLRALAVWFLWVLRSFEDA